MRTISLAALTPVFFLQSGLLDPQEKVRRIGEEVAYAFTDKISRWR